MTNNMKKKRQPEYYDSIEVQLVTNSLELKNEIGKFHGFVDEYYKIGEMPDDLVEKSHSYILLAKARIEVLQSFDFHQFSKKHEYFKVDEFVISEKLKDYTWQLKKITANDIKTALWHHYTNYDYKLFNSYIFDWESDFFAISKDKNYMHEIEIKISRSDFKADFKKGGKHELLKLHKTPIFTRKSSFQNFNYVDGKRTQLYSGVSYLIPGELLPNRFYYACPEGLLKKEEIPEYAGLLYYKGWNIEKIKEAPFLHKNNLMRKKMRILLDKFYYASMNKKQRFRYN